VSFGSFGRAGSGKTNCEGPVFGEKGQVVFKRKTPGEDYWDINVVFNGF